MRQKMKKIIVAILVIISMPTLIFAHSGRTDSSGGHHDNSNKSGLGSYHYHCGGHPAHLHPNGVCPYSSSSSSSSGSSSSSSSSSSKSSTSTTPKKVYATKVTSINSPSSLKIGESAKLECSVYPSNAEDNQLTYESSNTDVASISSTGEITAKSAGTTTIKVSTERGTSYKYDLTVSEIEVTNINIESNENTINLGNTKKIKITIEPQNATKKDIEWSSENSDIISVDSNGNISANSIGKTIISAKHGDFVSKKEIEVVPIWADKVSIKCELKNNDIEINDQTQLNVSITPENTTDKNVLWESSNNDIAYVDEEGTVHPVKTGKTVIKVSSTNGKSDEIEITVYSNKNRVIAGSTSAGVLACASLGVGTIYYKNRKKEKE